MPSISHRFAFMGEMTNLTDRISHLRDRKGGSAIVTSNQQNPQPEKPKAKQLPERRLASDYFMFFVYLLLATAMGTQLLLIIFLDIL